MEIRKIRICGQDSIPLIFPDDVSVCEAGWLFSPEK